MVITSISVALIIMIILVCINAMLASMEISLLALSEGKLQALANDQSKKAKYLLAMKQKPSRFLSTIQIGITLAGLLSGAFAADTLAAPLVKLAEHTGLEGLHLSTIHAVATLLITLLMTLFMLVFGELLPKRIAMVKPEVTAFLFITPIHIFSIIVNPIVNLLSSTVNGLLKLFGIDPNQEPVVTEDEILFLLDEAHKQGQINAVELQVASNLFAFTDLKVKDAMTSRAALQTLTPNTTLREVYTKITETGLSKFPIVQGSINNVIGIVYSQDAVSLHNSLNSDTPMPIVKDFMCYPFHVSKNKMLVELFTEMKQSRERVAIVVDENNDTVGIITLVDILKQIVGDFDYQSCQCSQKRANPSTKKLTN